MNNIVIVEDKLQRGISLAKQFVEWGEHHPDLEINVLAICFFGKKSEQLNEEISDMGMQQFSIRPITLWDFNEVLDGYMEGTDEPTTIIIDFILEGDGSFGNNLERVNIRYARKKERINSNRLWFYTATGEINYNNLCKLVGNDHVLEVSDAGRDRLRLNLEDERFMNILQGN